MISSIRSNKRFPDKVQMTIYLSPEAHKQLAILAAEKGVKVQVLLRDGVNRIFAENELPRIA